MPVAAEQPRPDSKLMLIAKRGLIELEVNQAQWIEYAGHSITMLRAEIRPHRSDGQSQYDMYTTLMENMETMDEVFFTIGNSNHNRWVGRKASFVGHDITDDYANFIIITNHTSHRAGRTIYDLEEVIQHLLTIIRDDFCTPILV